MADYSFWLLGESQISLTGGVSLDGITQGDGSHLVGESLTINSKNFEEVFVSDNGPDTNVADNDGNQRLDGDQTIDGVSYSDGTRIEAEYQFILRDPNTGIEYRVLAININNSSPTFATNEAVAFVGAIPPSNVALEVISAREGPPNGGPNAVDESDIVPLCFCAGTLIATTTGAVPVEDLVPGDLIETADHGAMPLRQIFHTTVIADRLSADDTLRPVRITAGALGLGLPERDLLVSRQHRILVSSPIAKRMFGRQEVLVAAIKLTQTPGVYVDQAARQLDYFHLLFDSHQIVFANGAPAESLFTGPEALKAVSDQARAEILKLFPELEGQADGPPAARPIPLGKKQKQLVARHCKNEKPLLEGLPR